MLIDLNCSAESFQKEIINVGKFDLLTAMAFMSQRIIYVGPGFLFQMSWEGV